MLMLLASLVCLAAGTALSAERADKLSDKTLVVWVRLDNLDQAGSGVVAIQNEPEFDSITFGERAGQRWMAGSHNFQRTMNGNDQAALAAETANAKQWLKIAVVYRGKQIEIWRNGKLYADYQAPSQVTYPAESDLYFGLRCIMGQAHYGYLKGAINEARIYNTALNRDIIARLTPEVRDNPKPLGCWSFNEGDTKDLMKNYPKAQLMGSASIKDNALILDGKGYALISQNIRVNHSPSKVQAGFYTPPHRPGLMWDTWLYLHDGVYYMYYIAGRMSRWDAHEVATSRDGVHWDYHGIAVEPRKGTRWVGTGHIWKSPDFKKNGLWILNYSEWFGNKQDIMFATSPDLLNWTKVDEKLRFSQDTRWYKPKGRWDCIDTVKGDDGFLYGYFTATPDSSKVDYKHCHFGFAKSRDGINWEALPPIAGDMNGEFGGIQKIGRKYYVTMSEGRIGVGDNPKGPFLKQTKNHNIFGGTIYFPRFFHTASGAPLMNHFFKQGPIYAAPLKAININDPLKGVKLTFG